MNKRDAKTRAACQAYTAGELKQMIRQAREGVGPNDLSVVNRDLSKLYALEIYARALSGLRDSELVVPLNGGPVVSRRKIVENILRECA